MSPKPGLATPRPNGRWRVAARFARRELRTGVHGFRIFLACIALGVAAIAAVGWVSEAMLAGLRQDGQTILGGDLELRLRHREIEAEQRAWLTARGDLSVTAEMRTMVQAAPPPAATTGTGTAAAPPSDERRLVELAAVDAGYPLYGRVGLDPALGLDRALERRDGQWGVVAEAGLLERLGLAPGDRLRIGEAVFELRAVLTEQPDKVSRGFAFGPSVLIARDSLAETGLIQPGSLVAYYYRLRVPPGGDIEALNRDLEAAFPDAGWRVRDTRAAAPGVKRFIDRLTLYLSLVGLTTLLVGGLGVMNAVKSYLDGKLATIATLKCLGATTRQVFHVYLLQIAAIAAIGIAAGLLVGAGAAASVIWVLGDRFGWQGAGGFYPQPLVLAAVFGLLVAATFAWLPLARAGRISPAGLFRALVTPQGAGTGARAWAAVVLGVGLLAAIAIWAASDRWIAFLFVCGAAGSFAVFRLAGALVVASARRLPRPRRAGLRLALANLHRPGAPTPSVVLSLGLGLTVLVAIALVEANLSRQMRESLPANAPALYFIDIQPDQTADFDRTVAAQPGVEELRRVPMLRGRITAVNGTPPDQLDIPKEIAWIFRGDRGLTWTREPVPQAELTAGRWWPADYDGPPLVSLDAEVGEGLGIGPGDRLTINLLGRNVEVEIANLRTIDWQDLGINFVMVFSPGLLEAAPQTEIATVRADPAAEGAIERAVTGRFANITAIRVREALETVAELIGHMATALRLTAVIGLAAGVLVLAGAVAAGHERRVYDAVVLKVLGATRRTLARAFLVEYGLLGLVTAVIAAAIGSLAAYYVVTDLMELSFTFLPGTVAATAFLGVLVALVLGFWGTWRALKHKSAPLLRND
ncbi:MAG: FtsX-like permease family protein [Kiloniellales bacterium]|nr:FtsX-like permease family protein [Kiloniellales bacterium]